MFKLTKSKKAALQLSINAIVILILAITMLGLGLTFTRVLFKSASSKMLQAVEGTNLKNPADAEHPVTIDEQIIMKRGSQEQLEVGFYNRGNSDVFKVGLKILKCIDTLGNPYDSTSANIPIIIAPEVSSIESASNIGYKAILNLEKENGSGLGTGSYICTLAACDISNCNPDLTNHAVYETVQFFLEVTP